MNIHRAMGKVHALELRELAQSIAATDSENPRARELVDLAVALESDPLLNLGEFGDDEQLDFLGVL